MSTSFSAIEAPVRVERSGPALVLTICRPHAGNSVDLATAEALGNELEQARGNRELRAIVITGEGDRFFCTGGDLKAYRSLSLKKDLARTFGRVRRLLDEFEAFPLPVIAAIDGYALGGGMELALACDLRFAAAHAKLGLPQSRLGLIPGWNGAERLVELIGKGKALRLLYSGAAIDAPAALDLGLVDGVAHDGRALDLALQYCGELAQVGPLSLAATKAAVFAAMRGSRAEARQVADEHFERLWFTDDHREAEAAFSEKRVPHFKGS